RFRGKGRALCDVAVTPGLQRLDRGTGALGQNHDDGGLQPDRPHLLQIRAPMTIRLDFHYQRRKVWVLEDPKGGPLKTGPPQDRDIWIGTAECPGGNLRAATFARYIQNLHALDDVAGEVAGTVRSFYRTDTSIATSA